MQAYSMGKLFDIEKQLSGFNVVRKTIQRVSECSSIFGITFPYSWIGRASLFSGDIIFIVIIILRKFAFRSLGLTSFEENRKMVFIQANHTHI